MSHSLRWHTGASLWPLALADGGTSPVRFSRPVILRFAGDDFMERFQRVLSSAPDRVSDFAVRQETWQAPQVGWLPLSEETKEPPPKLYQPVHNRFYLVAGQFVCQQRGLPDRAIDAGADERTSFVIRKLVDGEEHGWFGDRQAGLWRRVSNPDFSAPDGEERLAMFPFSFAENDRRRRLMAGLIPVASRELYEGADPKGPLAVDASEPSTDPRMARFSGEIAAELKSLGTASSRAEDARDRLVSLLIMFADFLADVLPAVVRDLGGLERATGAPAQAVVRLLETHKIGKLSWAELVRHAVSPDLRAHFARGDEAFGGLPIGDLRPQTIAQGARRLYESNLAETIAGALLDPRLDEAGRLLDQYVAPIATSSWLSDAAARDQMLTALATLAAFLSREATSVWEAFPHGAHGLDSAETATLTFLHQTRIGPVPLAAALLDADEHHAAIAAGDASRTLLARTGVTSDQIRAAAAQLVDSPLLQGLAGIFEGRPPKPLGPPAPASAESLYVIRCVFDRPACAGFLGPVVGRASRPFRLAAYYDPDAPVRPLKIRMPLDTTPEGLRKFPKGVSVILSDELRKQMARAEAAGMKGLIDGPPDGPTFDLGVICSLSIPIISICALVLLMVIVNLLNLIFKWLPMFKICLPVPVKAK